MATRSYSDFVSQLKDIHRHGFFLVPDIRDTWSPEKCCFHLVPLSDEIKGKCPPHLLAMTMHPRFAVDAVRGLGLAYEPENADEFDSLLRRAYPSLVLPENPPKRDIANGYRYAASYSY